MKTGSKLVWKLSAGVVAILAVAIALSGYANNLICAHYSTESARAFLRFNSESLVNGIGQMMMSRNNQGIREFIIDISRDSDVYGNIRYISHHTGEVVCARLGDDHPRFELGDAACTVCHSRDDPGDAGVAIIDSIVELPDGDRTLSVVAPITNEPQCRACHVHSGGPQILGFLNTEYSLERVDSLSADRAVIIIVTVFASLGIGIVALRLMFTRLLERPIGELVSGTKLLAAGQLEYRFDTKRDDEIGVLKDSFDAMAARVAAHRAELRTTLEYLGGIVENSADIIVTVTPEGHIETFNRGAEKALGYNRTEVIGKPVELLFADPADRRVAIGRLKDSESVKNFETRFLAKDGSSRDVLLTLSYLRDPDGNPIGTFGISKDITQEKELLRKLVQSKKFAGIGQAVTGIQHAIKNMLNGLKGGAYLVRHGMTKDNREQVEEGWSMVEEGIERIRALSASMLSYVSEWRLDLQRADLADLLARICDLYRESAHEKGVTLSLDGYDGLPVVLCDPKLIHMAVSDIVVNAVDACTWKDYPAEETPEVRLLAGLSENGRVLAISVRDNGCGMSEDIKANIFAPFFSTKKSLGTGLGLALTARIIRLHGGEISVESDPDRGTEFRIELPVDGPGDSSEAADGQASSRG